MFGDLEEVMREVLLYRKFVVLYYMGSMVVFRKLYGEIGKGVVEGRY